MVVRILQVLTVMNRGGAETMVMNYYRALDKTRYQFDFLVHRKERGVFDDEIEQMGGHIYRAFPIRPWSYLRYFHWLDSFFSKHQNEFVAVHSHIQDNSGFVFKYAAKYGIERRISTSHIASYNINLKLLFRKFGQWYGDRYTTCRLACGEEAGKLLYGSQKFEVFKNAIDSSRFVYDAEQSIKIKAEYGLKNKLVIGNVARFCPQKNHRFLIDIFEEIYKKNKDAVLLLVGDGELMPEIKETVQKKHLQESVIFSGVRSNVPDYLNIFDIFLFPSLYEGLPVSIIEAQAAGLRCVLSDSIDSDTDISGDVTFVSLESSASLWAEVVLSCFPYIRKDNRQKIIEAGYDVSQNIDNLISLYLK